MRKSEACIIINNKSQCSVATCLRCGELFSIITLYRNNYFIQIYCWVC